MSRESPPGSPPDILERIVETKREEVLVLRNRLAELRLAAESAEPARDFADALRAPGSVAVIAEVKRRSPGAGTIRPGLDPVELAASYQAGGAAALSVLTDRDYFGGSLDDLVAVRRSVEVPVLRKDFVIDDAQVYEARAAGADAVLLIVGILDDAALRGLLELAGELGMAALIEAHDAGEVERGLAVGAQLLGVNNRDLRTFRTDLAVTLGLLDRIPPDIVLVSESGIQTSDDVLLLGRAGVDAVLVGEALLRRDRPGDGVAALTGQRREPRAR